ncbi:hypothetical protein ASA1KI_40150 [Opitutales bacterium ASA1]|jgi:protein TonB|uniref:energy transducer TonB n=1 Tax=Congregicoccus parvus TaxID=3081749 RepID=UPI002B30B26C|nr:hypothetical protein ASA1KI_40150 [Opitutales bacterium ASA1]
MKTVYARSAKAGNKVGTVGLSIAVTLILFIAVPLANLLSISNDDGPEIRALDTSLQPPPPPPTEPPPPPEEQQEEEKPELDKTPPPLSLAALDVLLNPGTGAASGDFGMGVALSDFDALDELRVFELSELDKTPNPVQRIAPTYPYEAKQAGLVGWVRVLFVVDETGSVRNARVDASSHREFEAAALDAIRLWKFTPGMKDGAAVRTRMLLPFKFSLNN